MAKRLGTPADRPERAPHKASHPHVAPVRGHMAAARPLAWLAAVAPAP
jgi:hypothetical protein